MSQCFRSCHGHCSTRAHSDPAGCEGGGFTIAELTGANPVSGTVDTTIAAANLGQSFLVRGRYVEFRVVSASFGVQNWTLTGAANPIDITGGRRTVVFASKTPDHRGLVLTSGVSVESSGADLVIARTGPGLSMKLQAKDCANGGVFQMELERGDGGTTDVTHTLGADDFYFDNQNFRAREGDAVRFKDTTVVVTPRVNFANDFSPRFVGRDSPQVATRINQACVNQIRKRDGTLATVDHCGGVSLWRVSSGGRLGQVMGEDATEVAPPATPCTHKCQAQNRVRGRSTILGFPFPVLQASRLTPRLPS